MEVEVEVEVVVEVEVEVEVVVEVRRRSTCGIPCTDPTARSYTAPTASAYACGAT